MRRRELNQISKLFKDYARQFGFIGVHLTPANVALLRKSLASGQDHLAEERRRQALAAKAYARRLARERAKPFTAEQEQHMTALVKKRRLYHGACQLRWQDYFEFRTTHECEPLTGLDKQYLGLWTEVRDN
jgi:hypothetical protein